MESFIQGHRVGQNDLVLNLYARYYSAYPYQTFPYTPVWIRYDVGFLHPVTGSFMLIGKKERIPDIIETGKIRPNFIIEDDWKPGVYEIRWYYRASEESATQAVTVEFSVTTNGISQPIISMENHFDLNAYMILY
jgi:uncharacterized protein YodC (DUF2158 family)